MRTLVIGGGNVGSYLATKLALDGHVVSLIEADEERAMKTVHETGVLVFAGDGTDVGLLRRADVGRSEWVFAVTGLDDVNLVASQLASTLGAKNVLARLNDPANAETFTALGINTVAVTDLMVGVIESDLAVGRLESNTLLAHGKLSVSEFQVGTAFKASALKHIELPESSLLVAIERGDDVEVPHGDSVIRPGDRLLVASRLGVIREVQDIFDCRPSE